MNMQNNGKASKIDTKEICSNTMQVIDIEIHPIISKIHKMSTKTRNRIKTELDKYGFDKDWVLPVYKIGDKHILATEQLILELAKKTGVEKVKVVVKEFNNLDDAIVYYFQHKIPSGAEILKETKILMNIGRQRKGEGRAADIVALRLGLSPSTIYQALFLLKNNCEKSIQTINEGYSTIKSEYMKYHSKKTEKPIINLNLNMKVKDVIYLLIEAGYEPAAKYLIKIFTKKDE